MESFSGSVQLMFFVYALAAVVSFAMAGVIKLIFAGVQWQKSRAVAQTDEPGNGAPEKTA
jgi:hypothetical protein